MVLYKIAPSSLFLLNIFFVPQKYFVRFRCLSKYRGFAFALPQTPYIFTTTKTHRAQQDRDQFDRTVLFFLFKKIDSSSVDCFGLQITRFTPIFDFSTKPRFS